MRFEIEQMAEGKDSYYRVKDTQAKRWNLPEQAVTIFFGKRDDAQATANALNREWSRFLANPR